MIAIDPMNEHNGCLKVLLGRHREGLLGSLETHLNEKQWNNAPWRSVVMDSGDVVFFSGYLPHRSAGNNNRNPSLLNTSDD